MTTKKWKTPSVQEIRRLLVALKAEIGDDYRCDDEAEAPSMLVTIGASPCGNWSYQTGDNSYSGGAYDHRHWGLVYLYRDTNCLDAARDCVNEIAESMSQTEGEA